MKIEKEMLKGYIDIIILALLYKKDFYGYELARQVKTQTDSQFELKEGTLYLAFKRLEQNGYITSYWGDESAGGRRKYYKITLDGQSYVSNRKKEWIYIKEVIELFLEGVD